MQNKFYSNREIGCLSNPSGGYVAWYLSEGIITFVKTENKDVEIFRSSVEAIAAAGFVFLHPE